MSPERPVQIPDGFEKVKPRGPFIEKNGAIWRRTDTAGDSATFGFLPDVDHTNGLGFVHGGMIATLLDNAMAMTVFERFQCRLVTERLSIDYSGAVFPRRWLEIVVSPLQAGSSDHVAAKAVLKARGMDAARAHGTYKLFAKS